jgi:Protein of unknown function (DUF3102)
VGGRVGSVEPFEPRLHASDLASRQALGKRAVADIIEIGRRLIEAKAIAGHGGWELWLEREFGWGDTTARNFMNVAHLMSKSATVADLSIDVRGLYRLAAPSTPAEVVEAVADARGPHATNTNWKRCFLSSPHSCFR